jgi:acetyl-CoA acetyltransferase
VIACGVESMSRVPMFSTARGADTSGELLRGRYPEGLVPQGVSAELLAVRWKLEREELDAFSARSHHRAAATADAGGFANEIVPVGTHATDETVRPGTTAEGLAQLKPAFPGTPGAERFPEIDWRVTAGNSSPLTDGASAALIMNARTAKRLGLRPRARFHSFGVTGSDPLLMLDGVVAATHKVLTAPGCRSATWTPTRSTRRSRSCPCCGSTRWTPTPSGSTRAAAPSRSAIPSAPPAPGCSPPSSTSWKPPVAATACRPCVRAAAWPTPR